MENSPGYIAISCDECGAMMYDCRKKNGFMKIECDTCDHEDFRAVAKKRPKEIK